MGPHLYRATFRYVQVGESNNNYTHTRTHFYKKKKDASIHLEPHFFFFCKHNSVTYADKKNSFCVARFSLYDTNILFRLHHQALCSVLIQIWNFVGINFIFFFSLEIYMKTLTNPDQEFIIVIIMEISQDGKRIGRGLAHTTLSCVESWSQILKY